MKKRWLFILTVLMIAATLFVACNSDIADTKVSAQSGKELVYATFGNSSSKALTVNYDFIDYTKLYWFYQATKEDHYGTTGEVIGNNWAKVPGNSEGKGLDGTVGPFSQGLWSFNLAGYKTRSTTEPTGVDYIQYGDYYYSGLVYSGASIGTVSLKYGDSNAIPVTVQPSGNTGKIYLNGITYAWVNPDETPANVTLQIKITPVSGTPWTDSREWVYDSGYTLTGYVLNSDSGVEIPTGTYNLDFTVCAIVDNDVAYEFANQSLSLTVFGSQTTTVKGSLEEGLFVENAHFVATDVASVIVIPTTTGADFETDKTPAGSGENKKTTVTVPTGTLTTGTQNNMTIELVSIDIAQDVASQKSWTVASDSSAVAALTITLKEVVTTTDPTTGSVTVEEKPITTFDEAVTVTTYIETGLTGVQVFYNGNLDQPTDVTYDATTGCLTFKTTHFSEFYVTSTSEVLNVETGVKYTTLADAVDKAIDGQTLRLIKDITDPGLVINKSIILDLNGKTWTCSAVGTNPNTRAMTITGSSDFTLIDTSEDVNNITFGSRKAGKIITSNALFGAIRFDSTGKLVVSDVTLENAKAGGLNIKIVNGKATIYNVTINAAQGGGIEVGGIGTEVFNCNIHQTGTETGEYSTANNCAITVCDASSVIIDKGHYSGTNSALYIDNSGGTMVIKAGEFSVINDNNYVIGLGALEDFSANLVIEGGSLSGGSTLFYKENTSDRIRISLVGGVYDHDPSAYVAEGYYADDTEIEGKWVVKPASSLFDGGTGIEDDPFIIKDYDTFQNVSKLYNAGYYYYKVKDGVESIDCSNWTPVYLNGSIDGNNVTISSLDRQLFKSVGKAPSDENYVVKNFTVNAYIKINGYGAALIFMAGNNLELNNITVHGYIEGNNGAASFVCFGPGNLSDSATEAMDWRFVNCISDATIVATGDAAAGFVKHPLCYASQQGGKKEAQDCCLITIEDSAFLGILYHTGNSPFKYKYFIVNANDMLVKTVYSQSFIDKYGNPEGTLYTTPTSKTSDGIFFIGNYPGNGTKISGYSSYGTCMDTYLGQHYSLESEPGVLPDKYAVFTVNKADGAVLAKAVLEIAPNDPSGHGSYLGTYMSETIDISSSSGSFTTSDLRYFDITINGTGSEGLSGNTFNVVNPEYGTTHNGAGVRVTQYDADGNVKTVTYFKFVN